MPSPSTDIVIVGGAVVGCAVAFALSRMPERGGRRIVVVERDPSYRDCATARSAGGLRQQFSTPESIALSQATLALIRDLQAVFGPDADVSFREHGYLLLASAAGREVLAGNVALQRAHGAEVHLLDPGALAARFPWLHTQGLGAGGFGISGEGWLDPMSLLGLLRAAARAADVKLISKAAIAIEIAGSRVVGVRLAGGDRLACGHLVVAAGPQSGAVAATAGIALPVEPRKRFVFVLDCRDAGDALRAAPLTVDPSGVWFRPEGRQFICGASPESDAEEPAPGDLEAIDHELFERRIWPVLADRVPAFAAVRVTGAWAGHYDYNTLDQNAVIGPHPDVANLHFACGFSGHGLQHAVGAGRAVAQHILLGHHRTLDLARLGYARIARGEPLVETNVI